MFVSFLIVHFLSTLHTYFLKLSTYSRKHSPRCKTAYFGGMQKVNNLEQFLFTFISTCGVVGRIGLSEDGDVA